MLWFEPKERAVFVDPEIGAELLMEAKATMPVGVIAERWSRNFRPVVKVDRMTKEVIQNEETKEPFT